MMKKVIQTARQKRTASDQPTVLGLKDFIGHGGKRRSSRVCLPKPPRTTGLEPDRKRGERIIVRRSRARGEGKPPCFTFGTTIAHAAVSNTSLRRVTANHQQPVAESSRRRGNREYEGAGGDL